VLVIIIDLSKTSIAHRVVRGRRGALRRDHGFDNRVRVRLQFLGFVSVWIVVRGKWW
jgi:hypothetical protein